MSSGVATEVTGAPVLAEAQYVKAKTCIWWDIENCQVPRSCDPYSIAQNISKSLADLNYKGVVTISAYGDTTRINSSVQQALSSTGIALNHVPAGIKDASDKKILVDMLIWGYDNPPPANHLLISGDRDFSNALHQLRMRKYNILLAQPEKVSQALVSAAKTVWLWTSLVVGGRPLEKTPNLHNTLTSSKSNIEMQSSSILYSSQPVDINQKNSNNGNFGNRDTARQISKTQSQPIISTLSSNGNDEGDSQSNGSSDSSNPNQKSDLNLGSNCKMSDPNPTPSTPKSQQVTDSVMLNAPCGSMSNCTPKNMKKYVKKIPSNTTTFSTDGSGAQDTVINDTSKIGINSTLSQPSSHVVPESSKPYSSTGPTSSYIQPCSDITSSNHNNGLTQPSHALAREGGNINSTSSSLSTKSSSQVLPESKTSNAPKKNVNTTTFTNNGSDNKAKFATKKNGDNSHKQQQNQYSQSYFQPRNLSGSNYKYSSSSAPGPTIRPNGYQSIPSTMLNVSHSTPIPDISKLNISNHPYRTQGMHGSAIFTGNPMSNNRPSGNLGRPAPTNFLQGQMGFILEALNILKSEKISPTEANISDCIRYGNINIQNFNVKMALDYAVEHQVVVMHKLGNCLPLYVGRNDTLWNCVNFMDTNANHSAENFDAVYKFLSSPNGRSAILSSQCRYQAAVILKQLCLKNLVLGEILQILHIIIQFRKWIIPNVSGWQPLAITVFINSNKASTGSSSTSSGRE